MKKILSIVLLSIVVVISSCNKIQELNVDYGERQYVSEFTGLIEAVNNLKAAIEDRVKALNQLLEEGAAKLALAIDANTGAIQVLSQSTAEGLSQIDEALLSGFKAVSSAIDDNGTKIVNAINSNGELLSLKLDSNGQLISASIISSVSDLISNLNEGHKSLQDKLATISAALEARIADTQQSIDLLKEAISKMDGNLDNRLAQIVESLLKVSDSINNSTTSSQDSMKELFRILEETAYGYGIKVTDEFPISILLKEDVYETMVAEKDLQGKSLLETTLLAKLTLSSGDINLKQTNINDEEEKAIDPCGLSIKKTAEAAVELVPVNYVDSNNAAWYKVFKTQEWIEYFLSLDAKSTLPYLYRVDIDDAAGIHMRDINSSEKGGSWYKFMVYHVSNESGEVGKAVVNTCPEFVGLCSDKPYEAPAN